ncbi:AI-2E family transporter [Planctomycetota bacterium]|nr:AI-2E family transporter [Planctomycetota bacterium]
MSDENKNDAGNEERKPHEQPANIHHTPRIPIWRRLWFQVSVGLLVIITVLTIVLPPLFDLLNLVSGVLIPLAIAFTLAYIVNPLVTMMERKAHISRPFSACAIMSLVAIAVLGLVIYVVPPLVSQSSRLIRSAPKYINTLQTEISEISQSKSFDLRESVLNIFGGDDEKAKEGGTEGKSEGEDNTALVEHTDDQASEKPEGEAISSSEEQTAATGSEKSSAPLIPPDIITTITNSLSKFLSTSFGVIASTLGFASYLALSAGIIVFAFFFFVWKFQAMIDWFVPFIPHTYKDQTLDMLKKMDASIAAFIRGRLIQMSIITVVLAVGWSICGVPFWLLLAIIGGLLNLIPYAPVLIWPTVILTTYLTALSGDAVAPLVEDGSMNYLAIFLWPSLVYFIAQGLDGWVVEPLVQGKATNLDPLTVMIVVLLGAAILGILGMLIAIPVAACVKIVSSEILLPKLREIAKQN